LIGGFVSFIFLHFLALSMHSSSFLSTATKKSKQFPICLTLFTTFLRSFQIARFFNILFQYLSKKKQQQLKEQVKRILKCALGLVSNKKKEKKLITPNLCAIPTVHKTGTKIIRTVHGDSGQVL